MNCKQAETWMDTALDGLESSPMAERPNGVPEEVRAHFDGCPACRGQWQLLTRAEAALRSPRIVPAPAGMLAEFRDRLAAEERHSEKRAVNPFSRWLWPMGSFAAAGMAAAFAIAMNVPGNFAARPPIRSTVGTEMARSTPLDAGAHTLEDGMGASPKTQAFEESERFGRGGPATPETLAQKRVEGPKPPSAERDVKLKAPGNVAFKPALPKLNSSKEVPPKPSVGDTPLSASVAKAQEAESRQAGLPSPRSETKGVAETRDRFMKRGVESRMAVKAVPPQVSGVPADAAGALGGFGGGGFGPAGPAGPVVKGDVASQRGGDERIDRLVALAERESLIAAEVSPALVTALQRPVSLEQRGPENVLTVLGRLSREADIEVQLEGKVSQLALSLQAPVLQQKKKDEQLGKTPDSQVPLWVALQSVAQQGKLQIVPEENRLVLRPVELKGKKDAAVAMAKRPLRPDLAPQQEILMRRFQQAPAPGKPMPGEPAAAKAASEPQALFLAPGQQQAYFFAYAVLPNPDPRVWPAMWGDLPKWLFTLPEERPEPGPAPVADSK